MTLINLIEKIQKDAKRQASDQVHLLDKLTQDVQNDRERLDTRLNLVDDTDVIKNWVMKRIDEAKAEMENKTQTACQAISKKLNRIFNENLLVPELIGSKVSGCKYPNLGEWIAAKVEDDKTKFD